MIPFVELLHPRGISAFLKAVYRRGVNLAVIVEVGNRLYPSRTALIVDGAEITYAELWCATAKVAGCLHTHYTLGKGKRVGIACRNHAECIYALFAVSLIGSDIYLIHPEMKQHALKELIDRLQLDLFIYEEELSVPPGRVKGATSFLPIWGEISIQAFLSGEINPDHSFRRSGLGKVVVLTSGSTGKPQPVVRRVSVSAFISPFISLLKRLRLPSYKSIYIATPFYHGFGLATLLIALILGKRCYLQPRFDACQAAYMIDRYSIETITVVPSMIGRLLEVPDSHLSSLCCIMTGGAMLHPSLIEKMAVRTGFSSVNNLYGTSEAGVCFIATPSDLRYSSQTIGKPLRGVKVCIKDAGGNILPNEKTGELWVKCGWSVQKKQWIATGDLAYRDKKGYYFLKGRVDDMVVSGGENVYPIELENILLKHPCIVDTAVVGVPDADFGQRLRAYIVCTDPDPDKVDLHTWLKKRCARHQIPRDIIYLSSMPYNVNGKIDKKALA